MRSKSHATWPRKSAITSGRTWRALALTATSFLGLQPSFAQSERGETEVPSLEQLLNIEVFSASKFAQKVSDAPSAVTIVTAADIKTYGYCNLKDILRSVRGLYVNGDRNYDYLGARGFARPGDYNTRVLLLIDGHRVNDPIYDQAPIGYDFPLDVDLIDRVEFVPGPGSALYGNSAFFGVINVLTKNGQSLKGLQLSGEAGSFRTGKGRLSWGRQDGDVDVLLSASAYGSRGQDLRFPEFDDPATNNGVANGLDYERHNNLLAKLSSGGLTLQATHIERTKGVPTASYGQVFNDPRSYTGDTRTLLGAKYAKALSDHWNLDAILSYGRYQYDGDYIYDYPPVTLNKDGARASWWNSELRFLNTSFARHKIIFGAEYRRAPQVRQFNFDEFGQYLDDSRTKRSLGLFLQDEFTLSERWILNAGIRQDRDYSANTVTNPRLAVIYKPQPQTTLKLLYGSAFRAGNAYEADYVTDVGASKGNPDLRPEKIRTTELVAEHYIRNDWKLTAAAFTYRVDNLITFTTDPEDGFRVFRNVDEARARGVELETERLWGGGSRLRASLTTQATKDGASGGRLTNSPRHIAKLNYQRPFWGEALRAGVELQLQSSLTTVAGERLPGYGLANLTLLSAKLVKGLEVSASVYNLFDREVLDPASEEHVDSLGRRLRGIPQDGRSFRLKLTYAF
jgi:iron complex outermembrane receptor protein